MAGANDFRGVCDGYERTRACPDLKVFYDIPFDYVGFFRSLILSRSFAFVDADDGSQ